MSPRAHGHRSARGLLAAAILAASIARAPPARAADPDGAYGRFDGDLEVAYVPAEDLRAWVRAAYVFTDFNAVDINDSAAIFDRFQRTEQFDTWLGVRKQFTPATAAISGPPTPATLTPGRNAAHARNTPAPCASPLSSPATT